MPLKVLDTIIPNRALPAAVRSLLRDADQQIADFQRRHLKRPIPGFLPSDFTRAWAALRTIRETHLAAGDVFCEWGSGFGVVACLAAMLGFDAHGIEIDAELVESARHLAEAHGLEVRFAQGTLVPPGGEAFLDAVEDFAWLQAGGHCGHDELGLDPDEVDVVYAFPWPGEEQVVTGIFERFAGEGALLVTYHGLEDIRLHRKCGAAS
ncbi:MAG: class I SAM-dependent methyltransferase [Planctomycetes bacterium]|nr:class I SAM-dependent methyltransferase [Planctomycetota bacterium]